MKTKIQEVADGIFILEAQIPGSSAEAFSVYFIKENKNVLIEPGPAALLPIIREAMANLEINRLDYVIPTHIHMDHTGGIGELIQLFPQATAVVHPNGARHLIDPTRWIEGTKQAYDGEFESIYGPILSVPEQQVKIAEDGEQLNIGSRELRIIHTPGHTPNHIAIYDTKVKGIFCGEALGILHPGADDQIIPAIIPGFDEEAYVSSMERLRQLNPQILFYAHEGGVRTQADKFISRAIENSKLLGSAVLNIIQTEKSKEAVNLRVGEYILNQFGIEQVDFFLNMSVAGYHLYFKKKGMILSKGTNDPKIF